MKKIMIAILLAVLFFSVAGNTFSPVHAQDFPAPPLSPQTMWQPPYEGVGSMDPPAKVERYGQTWSGLQLPPPSPAAPGVPSSIIDTYLVNNYGQIVTNLYRNGTCYLVLSVNGPGYFYLWEYYPFGAASYGHWLSYRWYCPYAGIWKIGPFSPESLDPPGEYTWKMWYLSGINWSTRSLSFNFTRNYYAPDIPGLLPVPAVTPPVINSFSAVKSSVETGETTILNWATTNTNAVTISPDIGAVQRSGSTSVTPLSTTTYTLQATGKSGASISSSVTVTVIPRVSPTLSIGRNTIENGESTSLSWYAPGATRVFISNIGEVKAQGSAPVSPEKTTTYFLTASYIDGTVQSTSVMVIVEQPPYLLWGLIALAAIAAIVIVLLLARRPVKASRPRLSDTQIGRSAQREDTNVGDTLPATTPLMEAAPGKLIVPGGEEILLAGNARSLGRRDFEELIPPDQVSYISRQHITIWSESGKYYVEDRNSTNGTKLNGTGIKGSGRNALTDGDEIELAGKLSIIFKENIDKEAK